jgi:hypothetical protein
MNKIVAAFLLVPVGFCIYCSAMYEKQGEPAASHFMIGLAVVWAACSIVALFRK